MLVPGEFSVISVIKNLKKELSVKEDCSLYLMVSSPDLKSYLLKSSKSNFQNFFCPIFLTLEIVLRPYALLR